MTFPAGPVPVPAVVAGIAAGRPVAPVTFQIGGPVGAATDYVDRGSLGVADRWADLAVATMALDWNFPGSQTRDWEHVLLAAYGTDPDPVRLNYYRRLWDAPKVGDG